MMCKQNFVLVCCPLLLVFLPLMFSHAEPLTVEELLIVIEEFNATASNHVAPEDASSYFENLDNSTKEYGTYDFIVIGAGASGSVIANRLSEIYEWKVLLLEAGGYGNDFTDIPGLASIAINSVYNWGYKTVPQDLACLAMANHSCPEPRGRGVGGTSLINTLYYCRGSAVDFDKLAKYVDDDTWSYKNVLPYFKKSENFHHRDPEAPVDYNYHSSGGYHNVEFRLPRNIFLESFLEANKELGCPVKEYNDETVLGASPLQMSTKNGKRNDDGAAWITPIIERKNLELLTFSYVTKILIDVEIGDAYGVEFVHDGKTYIAEAKKEVILCAGAIGTPKLLMLSGVGPQDHLESLGIHVTKNLEVGSSFREHVAFTDFTVKSNYTLSNQTLVEQIEDYLQGIGVLTAPDGAMGIAYYPSKLNNKSENADIEIALKVVSPYNTYNFVLETIHLHVESTGTVRLKSRNPADYPLIDPRLFTDAGSKDLKTVYESIQVALNLINTDSFKKIGSNLDTTSYSACVDYEYLSDEYWFCVIRQLGKGYHPTGTCPMGPDPNMGSVVDSRGKVYGIKRFRISDGSVFPFTLSGHPHPQILMVAEKISDFIKEDNL